MAYDTKLADRVRAYLSDVPKLKVKEKVMFSGVVFMVNDKMCVNVSHENLMCRFDPQDIEKISERKGFMPMIMRGKTLDGYCYVSPDGFKSSKDFDWWMKLCLDFNPKAKSSKKKPVKKAIKKKVKKTS
jgi:TfoX/Sxy family transcriptional regulator of competence genes